MNIITVCHRYQLCKAIQLLFSYSHILNLQGLYKHLPHQRKLTEAQKAQAISLLSMKANKKMVQHALCQETGNIVLLKDLSNLTSTTKKTPGNDMDVVVKTLTEKYGKYWLCR